MAKHIACNDVVAGCSFAAQADNEGDLVDKVKAHAAEAHGVNEITPELAAKAKAAIQTR